MKTTTLIILLTFAFIACSQQHKQTSEAVTKLRSKKSDKYFKKVTLFNDSSYIFTLTTIDTTDSYDTDKPTAVINLYHIHLNTVDTLINDSLFCRNSRMAEPELEIEFKDYNFDGVKDILIPRGSDPRENHGFHLYLVNSKSKMLNYVKGFEEIGNPKVDTVNKLIESFVLSGQNFYKFYSINKQNKLIDLGHEVDLDFDENDSLRHAKALFNIVSERKTTHNSYYNGFGQ
jgi:hypothetical protein